MARTKTTEMSTITAAQLADGDLIPVIDVSDTTMSSTGTNKKLAKSQLAEAAGVTAHLADTSDAHDASAISFSATGNLSSTDVQAAIAELDTEKAAVAEPIAAAHIADTSAAHAASAVSFSATGSISSTDVQAAIAEVDSDLTAHTGDTSDAHDASAISVLDTAGNYTATDVEAVLAELPSRFGPGGFAGNVQRLDLAERAATSKGGSIGVGNKAVISLRFDDYHDAFQANILPLLIARGLPAGFASIDSRVDQPWFSTTTWDQVRNWNQRGVEIWSHGHDHKDPTPDGDAGLVEQIVTSKAMLEAQGMKVQGWMQPGATPVAPPAVPYGVDMTQIEHLYTSRAGQLILGTYPLSCTDALGSFRTIPTALRHGLSHSTVSDGVSYASTTQLIDVAIRDRLALQLMCHAGKLGEPGNMTLAEFANLLDYIVAAWDAGTVEVLTPSGMMFADRSTNRLDLFRRGDFESISTNDTNFAGWGSTFTVETTGGVSGNNFLRGTATGAILSQRVPVLRARLLDGETFVFDAWARANSSTFTTTRILLQSYPTTTALNLDLFHGAGTTPLTWTKVRFAFTIPPGVDELLVGLGRTGGGGCDWDEVHVYKV